MPPEVVSNIVPRYTYHGYEVVLNRMNLVVRLPRNIAMEQKYNAKEQSLDGCA